MRYTIRFAPISGCRRRLAGGFSMQAKPTAFVRLAAEYTDLICRRKKRAQKTSSVFRRGPVKWRCKR